ncbi:MAG: STAS domain-containing protein [Ruminococcus sp.]|nr:STAS domain-containing protein [Ruminococcus sp.]MBQ7070135.1 STAS domain-containing protein [Ruminococcus sp.]
MDIKKSIEGGKAVFKISGKVDTLTAPTLEKELDEVFDTVEALEFDLENLTYISSAGLRVLLTAHNVMEDKDGEMKVINVHPDVMEIFEITGFDSILELD